MPKLGETSITPKTEFGARLRELRLLRGLSQAELAKQTHTLQAPSVDTNAGNGSRTSHSCWTSPNAWEPTPITCWVIPSLRPLKVIFLLNSTLWTIVARLPSSMCWSTNIHRLAKNKNAASGSYP